MEKRRLMPKNDLIFRNIFANPKNAWILKGLISDLYDLDIKELTINDPFSFNTIRVFDELHSKDLYPQLQVRAADILAQVNQSISVTMEMQVKKKNFYRERATLYLLDAFTYNYANKKFMLDHDNKYSSLEPAYGINIIDYTEFSNDNDALHYFSMDDNEHHIDGLLKQVFFELGKPNINVKNPVKKEHLKYWQAHFDGEIVGSKAPDYIKASSKLADYNNLTMEEQMKIDLYEKAKADYEAELSYQRHEGIEEGVKQGVKQGKAEGREEERRDFTISLLKKGFKIEEIHELTKLSLGEIEELKNSLS